MAQVYEMRVKGGEHGSGAIYYLDRRPTKAQAEKIVAGTNGDGYTIRPVTEGDVCGVQSPANLCRELAH